MEITQILSLCGGIGMFLYGMKVMSDAINKLAGAKMESILESLTNSKLKGFALGTAITAIIQSSAATSIMVIGFVNAGIMALAQAVPVIFGANIGSTITGQILRLGDISADNIILTMIKPSSFAPILVAVGAFVILFSKKKRTHQCAEMVIGLGILFMGMSTMEGAIAPLKDDPRFQRLFLAFTNPFIAILIGAVVTAVIQSSSASVGILQALSSTGAVTWSMVIPIILGQNIGKCFTVWLGSMGTNKDSKRVSFIHLFFNVAGALVIGIVIYSAQAIFGFSFWDKVVNRGNIADFHTGFNVLTSILLFPFIDKIINLAEKIIPENESDKKAAQVFNVMDDIFLKTPGVALEQGRKAMMAMGYVAEANFGLVENLFEKYDSNIMESINENERFLDKCETKIGDYLIKITAQSLSADENRRVTEVMRNLSDFERIGDYCVKIAEIIESNKENGIVYSERCQKEIHGMIKAVHNILNMTVEAFSKEDPVIVKRILPLNEVISSLKETMMTNHVDRLFDGQCNVQSGIFYAEFLNAMDRIGSHCGNIAAHLQQRLSEPDTFDQHKQLKFGHDGVSEEYKAMFKYYESQYYTPYIK